MGGDVKKEADIAATVAAAVEAFGGLYTLVSDVGWGAVNSDLLAVTEEQMIDSYRLNTISAYRMTASCVPHLERAGNAAVINSGSFTSAIPSPTIYSNSTTKTGCL